MLIQIGEKRYPVKTVEDLTLKHIAKLQYELRSGEFDGLTSLRTLDDIHRAFGEWGNLPKSEQQEHPEGLFLTCFVVWASRCMAGDEVTLLDAIDFPAASLRFIIEPTDRAGESQGKAKPPASGGGSRPGKPKAKRH